MKKIFSLILCIVGISQARNVRATLFQDIQDLSKNGDSNVIQKDSLIVNKERTNNGIKITEIKNYYGAKYPSLELEVTEFDKNYYLSIGTLNIVYWIEEGWK